MASGLGEKTTKEGLQEIIGGKGTFSEKYKKTLGREKGDGFNKIQQFITMFYLICFCFIFFFVSLTFYSIEILKKYDNFNINQYNLIVLIFIVIVFIFLIHSGSLIYFIYHKNNISFNIYMATSFGFLIFVIFFYIFSINYYERSSVKNKINHIKTVFHLTLNDVFNTMIGFLILSIIFLIISVIYFLLVTGTYSIFSSIPSLFNKKLEIISPPNNTAGASCPTASIDLKRPDPPQTSAANTQVVAAQPNPYTAAPGCYGGATPKVIVFN